MLTILLGNDWTVNRDRILGMLADDVAAGLGGRILIVPELISHDMERRLCAAAGDTASRFAEVLSFTRLARRVADYAEVPLGECLDNGGRVVAMAAASRQLHSKLKAYASVETRPEFLTGLLDAVDEFKRCCIAAADLKAAAEKTEGSLAQKLEELSLLLEAYDSLCALGKRDPRDQMLWLLEELEDSDFGSKHVFYIDGFPDLTRQHTAILEHLIRVSPRVVVSLNCDQPGSSAPAFEKAGETALELLRCAQKQGIAYEIVTVQGRGDLLSQINERLFQGTTCGVSLPAEVLAVCRTDSVYEECVAAAEKIISLVQAGVRYRDISVVCADMQLYQNTLQMLLRLCGITVYQSGTESILEKSVIITVLSAMDAALGGFEQGDVLRYLRSMLSPVSVAVCDKLENYVLMWNINTGRWLVDWTFHPGGLTEAWDDAAREELALLNDARKLAIEPLYRLQKHFRDAKNLAQQTQALYSFLEEIGLALRLEDLAQELDERGDNRSAQILNQLWEILLSALEQLHDMVGHTIWDAETFTRLFKLLLSQYDVGTIPPVLDAVMIGPANAMRCQQVKHLIVLGALEGSFPGYSGSAGILSDRERVALRALGVPLTGGAMEGLKAEFADIYGVFCGATDSVTVFCPGGQPSFLYRRLSEMSSGEQYLHPQLGAALTNPQEAGAYLARWDAEQNARVLGVLEEYEAVSKKKHHTLGMVSREHVDTLYGKKLNLSASQIDRHAECALSYFLKYGLRAKERKPAEIDPAEFGTYVHAVLEATAKEVMERGGFRAVSLEETQRISDRYSRVYAEEKFSQLDTQRMTYLFRRNAWELSMIVTELWQELSISAFEPVDFELAFGEEGKLPAIAIPGMTMDAQLRGFVDRVDAWQEDGRNYFRVVDYKTGKKDFDYCDVFNGVGLQMLLYLFALEDGGEAVLGDSPIPAGVQYFPARAPLMPADGVLSDEEAAEAREKVFKRRGLLLSDEQVLLAMEPAEKPKRMDYTRKKDGTISGTLASREQLRLLRRYVFRLLGNMVDDIASGNVDPNPYTRGMSHNACAFCPYGAVCNPDSVEGRRNYKTMSAERFWEEIGKEMNRGG